MRWIALSLLALGLAAGAGAEEKKEGKVAEGQPAPNIKLEAATPAGTKTISLSDFKGKKNVVLFLTF